MEHLIQYSKTDLAQSGRVVNLEASTPLCSSKQKTQKAKGDLGAQRSSLEFWFCNKRKKAGMCYD